MNMMLWLALAALQPQDEVVRIHGGRSYMPLIGSTETFRGTCDGVEATATIEKAFRGPTASRLILRYRRFTREVRDTFLNGRLFGDNYYAASLVCDGRSIMFRARTVRMDEAGNVTIDVQSASMDIRTGELTVSQPRTVSREDLEYELGRR
jgi:hypothetical protein